jgi:hypothetical protein
MVCEDVRCSYLLGTANSDFYLDAMLVQHLGSRSHQGRLEPPAVGARLLIQPFPVSPRTLKD